MADLAPLLRRARGCLSYSLRRAARAVTLAYDEAMRPSGLRSTQFSTLAILRSFGPMPQWQVGRRMALDKTTLSRNVAVLIRRGWVRAEGGEDQRVRILSVTPDGEEAFLRAFPYWEKAQRRLGAALGKSGTGVLYQHLEAALRGVNIV